MALIGLLLVSLTATCDASAATPTPASSLQSSLAEAMTAAKTVGSARISVQFFTGSTSGRVVQDSTLHTGKQTTAIKKEVVSVVLVGGAAYISGNTEGLTSYFGLPSSLASTLTDKWVSIQPTDSSFQSISGNVDLTSALANVTPGGTLVAGKRSKIDGKQVRSIGGDAPGGAGRLTLFVAANKRALPVAAVESNGSGKSATGEIVTFTHWGERVHVATPTTAVPLSAIQAASSASG
jgi:hypothetical protein